MTRERVAAFINAILSIVQVVVAVESFYLLLRQEHLILSYWMQESLHLVAGDSGLVLAGAGFLAILLIYALKRFVRANPTGNDEHWWYHFPPM